MAEGDVTASGRLVSRSPQETLQAGRVLGRHAEPGDLIALVGPLGAGKTVVAKGVAEGLEVASVVNSPTFILMNEHEGRVRLFHVDAYRLTDPEEAVAAGLLDAAHAAGVSVIEWADRLDGYLPADRLDVTIEPIGETARAITWRARGPRHARLGAALDDLVRQAA
ncbi:MAG: tRNA (adenosine(37)-N6)-threonylcarbamoyltransferase complex ATPase subunit type 1 TsaE [Chloroflexota bacterium]|nr:tRNA (adenosine(37)-N6)-threonylcarbamoyltransferase complex ATPase subunit type 1 TsaE [Chloroflexota bacterium]